ncbi:unnamed protein product [Haemonchus placei]|uniref:Secreted protein n=1 Tax=Haemonchus placei TaxID=6290 RepID=A0A0N4VVU8_HAEPC|nr:unnamed protein product [Haemonchus placei]
MKCDFYTITLSIITGVVASPISDLIERTVVDEDSILSIPSPASALGMLDISEQKATPSSSIGDKGGIFGGRAIRAIPGARGKLRGEIRDDSNNSCAYFWSTNLKQSRSVGSADHTQLFYLFI